MDRQRCDSENCQGQAEQLLERERQQHGSPPIVVVVVVVVVMIPASIGLEHGGGGGGGGCSGPSYGLKNSRELEREPRA